ncbi:MAG: hypothetical protein IIV81_03445 [Clostridia bacterium]|nr:hypothetical protein [Clostridia bacterium]
MNTLKYEERYDFRKRMTKGHTELKRDANTVCADNEIEIKCGFSFEREDNSIVIDNAVKDFCSFMKNSMAVEKGVNGGIVLRISDDLGDYNSYKGYRIEADDKIVISGYDERGVAQALYDLEEVLALRRGPFVKKETVLRKPMFSPQMVHSGYGLEQYPDEYLLEVARSGRDTILVFVKGINDTRVGFVDFNDLIKRASNYGIDVYAYSLLRSEMHPFDEGAEEYYDKLYGSLFDACPGFKGLVLVGESVEFPSRDEHVSSLPWYNNFIDGIPTGKRSPGWFPCYDYADWLRLLQKVIYKRNPNMDIVFWSYNWNKAPEEDRVRLIESLPEGITLQATFEMGEKFDCDEVSNICADYTLAFEGPGSYFTSEAKAAHKRNMKFYSMTNTAGKAWDFGVIPYEPMPFQWIRRYEGMVKAHDDWGLAGIMEGHHYGMAPSFISRLSKWAFYEPRQSFDKLLDDALEIEYTKENKDAVKKALEKWSEAIRFFTPTDADQYGAFRVGMSYPFCLDTDIKMQSDPKAAFKGICYTYYIDFEKGHGNSFVSLRVPVEIRRLENMKRLLGEGLDILRTIENKNENLLYLENLGDFMYHNVITGINAKKWYCLTCEAKAERDREKLYSIMEEMEVLLKSEIENAKEGIEIVKKDSSLGWEPTMEYLGDEWHIRWKIRHAEYVLDTELARWKRAAKF